MPTQLDRIIHHVLLCPPYQIRTSSSSAQQGAYHMNYIFLPSHDQENVYLRYDTDTPIPLQIVQSLAFEK